MDIELLAVGINSAATALVLACVALLRLTVKNFKTGDTAFRESQLPKGIAAKRSANASSDGVYSFELHAELLRSVVGDSDLLKDLNLPVELSPSLLVNGDHLTSTAATIGFSNLELVTRELILKHHGDKPYLFGINRGGGLLANLLSQRLQLDQKYLVRCDYKPKWKRVMCEPRAGVNFAIIVDDAVRSGETVNAVKSKIKEIYPDAAVYVLALVVSGEVRATGTSKDERLFGLVDYYPWISLGARTALPWSDDESEEVADYLDQDGIEQLVGRLISHGDVQHNLEFSTPLVKGIQSKPDA